MQSQVDDEAKERIKQLAMRKMDREEEKDMLGIGSKKEAEKRTDSSEKRLIRFGNVKKVGLKIALPAMGLLLLAIVGYGSNELFFPKASQVTAGEARNVASLDQAAGDLGLDVKQNDQKSIPAANSDPAETAGSSRKIIQNMQVSLQVENIMDTIEQISSEAQKSGGYVVESYHRGSDHDSGGHITVKIPAEKLSLFQSGIANWGKILSKQISGNDITNEYHDTEMRLKHWQEEEKRYLDILKQAKSVEDILKVEGALANVRQQIEQLEGQIKFWDNQVNYAEVSFELQKNDLNPEIQDPWQPVKWQATLKAFRNALIKTISFAWNTLNYVFVGVGYLLPLVLTGAAGWGGYLLWRRRK